MGGVTVSIRQAALALFLACAVQEGTEAAALGEDIILSGTVLGKGAPCMQFRTSTGERISLQGVSPQDFKTGMKLRLTGRWLRISNCMQGRAFGVVKYTKV
jgi:hypothetical protein